MSVGRSAFLDASAWLAVLARREPRHQAMVEAYADLLKRRVRLITTSLVVAETHALVVRYRGPEAGLAMLDRLYSDPTHEVRFVDRDLERRAIDAWLRPYRDHRFSLADAVSFEVMRQEGIRRALALDRHFTVAGFDRIPADARS